MYTTRDDPFLRPLGGKPANILLVEDNPDHAELLIRGFEDHPVANEIRHLSDGESALDYLFQRGDFAESDSSPRPAMVLLDLRLPKVDGLEVLRQIRAQETLDDMPVIILSTSHARPDVQKAYESQANSYLVKPLDFASFSELIDLLGYYWLGWNTRPGQTYAP